MDIKFFTYILLFLAMGAYFIPVDNIQKDDDSKDIPLVIFEKPLMHTLNEQNVSRTVSANTVVRYETRDEMYDANIFLRNNLENKDYKIETLEAQIIIKKDDNLSLSNNVKYKRDDFINLNTNKLDYNLKTKTAQNNVPYNGNYFNNKINGNNLYLDGNKSYMKSDDVHFEIEVKNNK